MSENKNPSPTSKAIPAPKLPEPSVTHVFVEKGLGFGIVKKRPA